MIYLRYFMELSNDPHPKILSRMHGPQVYHVSLGHNHGLGWGGFPVIKKKGVEYKSKIA